MSEALEGFGPGKVILLGEHAVVYGHPALAAPLASGVWAKGTRSPRPVLEIPASVTGKGRALVKRAFEKAAEACGNPGVRIALKSELPVSMGLGSSAAVAVACAQVLLAAAGRKVSPRAVLEVALEMERVFHITPSGLDHTCAALGVPIHYRRGKRPASPPRVREVFAAKPLGIVVALVEGKRQPTQRTVAALRTRVARWPARYGRVLKEMGKLADEGASAMGSGDFEALGDAMNVNHGLLTAVGLSSPPIDALVHRLRAEGALGAKLTGAGGDGGAVIGLFREPVRVARRLSGEGVRCFASRIGGLSARARVS